MASKKPKKQKDDEETPKPAPASNETEAKPVSEDDRFDFGGLPKRDLKKNLGCG